MSDSMEYYLAGVFDGEGSISAHLTKDGRWALRCGARSHFNADPMSDTTT